MRSAISTGLVAKFVWLTDMAQLTLATESRQTNVSCLRCNQLLMRMRIWRRIISRERQAGLTARLRHTLPKSIAYASRRIRLKPLNHLRKRWWPRAESNIRIFALSNNIKIDRLDNHPVTHPVKLDFLAACALSPL